MTKEEKVGGTERRRGEKEELVATPIDNAPVDCNDVRKPTTADSLSVDMQHQPLCLSRALLVLLDFSNAELCQKPARDRPFSLAAREIERLSLGSLAVPSRKTRAVVSSDFCQSLHAFLNHLLEPF